MMPHLAQDTSGLSDVLAQGHEAVQDGGVLDVAGVSLAGQTVSDRQPEQKHDNRHADAVVEAEALLAHRAAEARGRHHYDHIFCDAAHKYLAEATGRRNRERDRANP